MSKVNPVREIVRLCGGLKKTAAALGHTSHSTVYGWVRSGRVPSWRHAELRDALKRNNIHIPESIYQNAFARTNKSHEGELA